MTAKYLKTVEEKLETKFKKLLKEEFVEKSGKNFLYQNKKFMSFSKKKINYDFLRISVGRIDPFYDAEFKVSIILEHENLELLSTNLLNPPSGAKVIYSLIKNYKPELLHIEIGANENKITRKKISITKELYLTINQINKEEGRSRVVRVQNRSMPFIKNDLGVKDVKEGDFSRDYRLLLNEIIASKQISSTDVKSLTKSIDPGEDSRFVIKQQINKQVDWLLAILREIIDEEKITVDLAKDLGNKHFKYSKADITGPEHLMEKILTDYGKNIIFGVPALLNTDKYVISKFPRVQFDIILIDNLADIEIVELKRSDAYVLDYDPSRNKFYPSKDLAVAIGQSERYITTIYKDNNPEYKINGKNIRRYIEDEVGGSIELNITRPSAMIVIGALNRIAKDYSSIPKDKKPKTRKEYEDNMWQAYRELKSTHKNIKITTYSELIDSSELRLIN